jgi:hypothetical protein
VRNVDLNGWRRKKKLMAANAPKQQDIDWVKVTYPAFYNAVDDHWSCPWCGRDKLSLMRPSKQAAWSFSVKDVWLAGPGAKSRSKVMVCQDCNDVRIQIAREAGLDASIINGDDVSSIILPQAHSQHQVKPDADIDHLIETLRARQTR